MRNFEFQAKKIDVFSRLKFQEDPNTIWKYLDILNCMIHVTFSQVWISWNFLPVQCLVRDQKVFLEGKDLSAGIGVTILLALKENQPTTKSEVR